MRHAYVTTSLFIVRDIKNILAFLVRTSGMLSDERFANFCFCEKKKKKKKKEKKKNR